MSLGRDEIGYVLFSCGGPVPFPPISSVRALAGARTMVLDVDEVGIMTVAPGEECRVLSVRESRADTATTANYATHWTLYVSRPINRPDST